MDHLLTLLGNKELAHTYWAVTGDRKAYAQLSVRDLLFSLGSTPSKADVLRAQTIAEVSAYVKENPNATDEEKTLFVKAKIAQFADNVAAL